MKGWFWDEKTSKIRCDKEKLQDSHLIILIMAMIRDPNATVPKWKKTALVNDFPSEQHGTSPFSHVQYQVAKTPARISSLKAEAKNMPQYRPKRLYHCIL